MGDGGAAHGAGMAHCPRVADLGGPGGLLSEIVGVVPRRRPLVAAPVPSGGLHSPTAAQPATHRDPNDENFVAQPRWVLEAKSWATVCGVLLALWVAYSVVVRPIFIETSPRVQAGTEEIVIAPPTHLGDDF